jgi:hypothetical protein
MKQKNQKTTENSDAVVFQRFLHHYLKNGIGSMSKSDVDALVMFILDSYCKDGQGRRYSMLSNADASQILRAPLSRIKKLRYEAALKYAENSELEAQKRFLAGLANASLEVSEARENPKIHLIIEDTLAKNWIQGKLKQSKKYYDGTFNTEVVKIKPEDFFEVLEVLFDDERIKDFRESFEIILSQKSSIQMKSKFAAMIDAMTKSLMEKAVSMGVDKIVAAFA